MGYSIQTFWLPKEGRAEEYEDAAAFQTSQHDTGVGLRCAVADGATESSFSGLWARLLVESYSSGSLQRFTVKKFAALAAAWQSQVSAQQTHKPLAWYAEEKLRQSAFATLLGLHLRPNGTWKALCIGDSCLFHCRPPQLQPLTSLPYTQVEQFRQRPALISTQEQNNRQLEVYFEQGTWQPGDQFLLMTDALSQTSLANPALLAQFWAADFEQTQFETLLRAQQAARLCRHDDLTLLKICISAEDVV